VRSVNLEGERAIRRFVQNLDGAVEELHRYVRKRESFWWWGSIIIWLLFAALVALYYRIIF
jgi:hypothetical protein